MILRLLIAAMMLLAIANFYLNDTKTGKEKQVKPKQKIENVQHQLDTINKQVEDRRNETMKEMGL